jgi:group I intron endonuclease
MGFVYRIRCKENGKSYIGRSLHDPLLRWKQHVYKSKRAEGRTLLGNAINKYGVDAFEIETLCEVPDDALDNMECYYAEQYQSYVWEGGYNQTLCGRGRPYDYKTNEETKRRMGEAQRNRRATDETKAKISKSMQGHKRCVGRVVSVASKGKNRASQPNLKLTDDGVRLVRTNPDNLSNYALAEKLGVSRSLVYLVACGKTHKDVV